MKYSVIILLFISIITISCSPEKQSLPPSSFNCFITEEQQQEIPYLKAENTPLELSIQICPTKQHLKDDGTTISKDDWDTAVAIVVQNLDTKTIGNIMALAENDPQWFVKQQDGMGLEIINLLRNHNINWGDRAVDNYWPELAENAAMYAESDIAMARVVQEKIKQGYEPMEING
ncbi:MAG: hypothetical protein Q8R37_01155 [Nanoarchaeota archaeon]|nr:hypothetical protein [Nanoarchaeota archaeon]